MSLLSGLLSVPSRGDVVRIGDLVHLSEASRPVSKRCCPATVTRVLLQGPRQHPPLNLHEMTDQTGNTKAKYPSGGWLHMSDAPTAPSTWHMRAECPDGR